MKTIYHTILNLSKAFMVFVLLTTCAKDYSYEGGSLPVQNVSEYIIKGQGSSCAEALLSGKYMKGVALYAANTIRLQAYVSKAGKYQQVTTTVNGFSFLGSGVFADTGWQVIILAASGIPLQQGNFTFSTTNSICAFVVPVDTSTKLIGYKLAGSPGECQPISVKGLYVFGDALRGSNMVDVKVLVNIPGPYDIHTDTINGFSFSATGTFSLAGEFTISLTGHGTPDLPGNYVFTTRTPFSTCTFSVEVINQQPLAIYVLESGGGAVISPCVGTVEGAYASGTALTGTNQVTIKAFVTQTGNFTIATGKVNGMSFSYTGTFAATGSQNVVLKGEGKPLVSGSFTLVPKIVGPHPLGGEACGFTVTVM